MYLTDFYGIITNTKCPASQRWTPQPCRREYSTEENMRRDEKEQPKIKQTDFLLTLFTKRNNISIVCLYYKLLFGSHANRENAMVIIRLDKMYKRHFTHLHSFLFLTTRFSLLTMIRVEKKTFFNYKIFENRNIFILFF